MTATDHDLSFLAWAAAGLLLLGWFAAGMIGIPFVVLGVILVATLSLRGRLWPESLGLIGGMGAFGLLAAAGSDSTIGLLLAGSALIWFSWSAYRRLRRESAAVV